jgi:hypothetical protein
VKRVAAEVVLALGLAVGAAVLVLLMADVASGAARPAAAWGQGSPPGAPVLAKVNEHRQATWACQHRIGLAPTPSAQSARRSPSVEYRRWVALLWWKRRRTCERLEKRLSKPVALGRHLAAAYGWVGAEWRALHELWDRESDWEPGARNSTSGACGIPQDIRGCRGRNAREQIVWGLRYIKGRYGAPSAALAFHNRNGWY